MVSYGDVRRWRPGPLADAERRLAVWSDQLLELTDELAAAAKPAFWSGSAADAAATRRDELADGLEHIVAAVAALRSALRTAAAQVAGLAATISSIDQRAESAAAFIDDAGVVTDLLVARRDAPAVYGAVNTFGGIFSALKLVTERDRTKNDLGAAVGQVLVRAEAIDGALVSVLGKVERREIGDGGATNLRDAAIAGAAQGPGLPGRPPNPGYDIGAGKYDVDPWYSKADDLALKAMLSSAAPLAGLVGWERAAKLLEHYLGNSGKDVTVNPEDMMRDMPGFRRLVQEQVQDEVRRIVDDAARDGTWGQPVQFTSEWRRDDLIDDNNSDWFNAIGTVDYAVTGVATVFPPLNPGDAPRVEMDYQTHIFDRYNWDYGHTATLGPITMPQDPLADLHRAGVAREFNTVGTSGIEHFSGPVPPAP